MSELCVKCFICEKSIPLTDYEKALVLYNKPLNPKVCEECKTAMKQLKEIIKDLDEIKKDLLENKK